MRKKKREGKKHASFFVNYTFHESSTLFLKHKILLQRSPRNTEKKDFKSRLGRRKSRGGSNEGRDHFPGRWHCVQLLVESPSLRWFPPKPPWAFFSITRTKEGTIGGHRSHGLEGCLRWVARRRCGGVGPRFFPGPRVSFQVEELARMWPFWSPVFIHALGRKSDILITNMRAPAVCSWSWSGCIALGRESRPASVVSLLPLPPLPRTHKASQPAQSSRRWLQYWWAQVTVTPDDLPPWFLGT